MTTLAPGSLFAGRYRVVRCIAAGGMGAVYEAVHVETERRRALKVMLPHLFQSEEMRERFKREARISAHVESEFVVDVSDAGVDDATGMPFLVMELLQGEELGARLARAGRLPPGEAMTYLQQAALALDRTHASNVVHRDLKPENIFLTRRDDGSPRVKILDFGIAKLLEGATVGGATRSLGTPLYMAPEQFRASDKLTPAADIHALGMMAYTLLVGEPYWAAEARRSGDLIAFAMIAANGPKEPATARAAAYGVTLPPGFDAWFRRATAVDPAARFPRASEAVRALGEVLGAAAGAPPAGVLPEAPASPGASAAPPPSTGLARVATSTGGAVTPALATPPGRRAAPFIVAAVVVAGAVLGTGAWLALRPAARRSAGMAAAVAATISTAPGVSTDAAAPPAAGALAPTTEPTAPVSSPAGATPPVTARPSTKTGPPGKATARATAGPVVAPVPILGRD
jgi:eukaryotic-like serine/threonine-protein kinase